MKIAIITRPDYKSPRILANSLKLQLNKMGVSADIFFSIDTLTRLHNYRSSRAVIRFHFWLYKRLKYFFVDQMLLRKLRNYDAIIISECSPNGFWKNLYHIEELKRRIGKPVLFYEVYYLGNTPSQILSLKEKGGGLMERYDWHLSVSDVTEIRSNSGNWSCIGLDLFSQGLAPVAKDEFIVLIDFEQQGYEKYREEQLAVLKELNIKVLELRGKYTHDEIKKIYKKSSILFMQSPEAFGLPIAECLSFGVQIFTPSSAWPMSWRQNEHPVMHGEGKLPDVFTVYNSRQDLKQKLIDFRKNYNLKSSPEQVFKSFTLHYPHFYYGNIEELRKVIDKIKRFHFI